MSLKDKIAAGVAVMRNATKKTIAMEDGLEDAIKLYMNIEDAQSWLADQIY